MLSTSVDLPAPGGPVTPITDARPGQWARARRITARRASESRSMRVKSRARGATVAARGLGEQVVGSVTGSHAVSMALARFAILTAAIAAPYPLLPCLPPARLIACSTVSVVSTPKITGIPVFAEALAMPLAAFARYVVVVVGFATDDGSEADDRVVLAGRGELGGYEGQLERAGNGGYGYVVTPDAVRRKAAERAIEKARCDEVVEFCHYDGDSQPIAVQRTFQLAGHWDIL